MLFGVNELYKHVSHKKGVWGTKRFLLENLFYYTGRPLDYNSYSLLKGFHTL